MDMSYGGLQGAMIGGTSPPSDDESTLLIDREAQRLWN